MAQQLQRPILAQTQAFREGYQSGYRCRDKRFDLSQPISEDVVLQIVSNLIGLALDGELNEAWLRRDCGMIVGYIVANA
jgi:hypothetical protein